MNRHSPLVALGLQSNSDAQPVVTRNQAEMYCCKYVTKHGKRLGSRCALMDVVDDMEARDSHSKDAFGEIFEEAKLGGKMHKVFMAEVGEEMSQSELAHHANRSSLHHFLCPGNLGSYPHLALRMLPILAHIPRSTNTCIIMAALSGLPNTFARGL